MAALPILTTSGKLLLGLARQIPTVAATGGVIGGLGIGAGRIGSALGITDDNDDVAAGRSYDLNKDKVENNKSVTGTDPNRYKYCRN